MRFAIKTLVGVLITCLLAGTALAATVVTLTPALGHPLVPVTISGTGFDASEAVDVFVDTVDTMLVVSSATGSLSASITIPATAQPGPHFITAIGRRSGDAAQASFKVTTPWVELGFGAAHQGINAFENTLNTSNVGSLGMLWTSAAIASGGATPVVASGRVIASSFPGVQALSTTTGKSLWSKLPADSFQASPAVFANVVYVGGNSGNMYALNATNGATNWTTSLGNGNAVYSSAVVVNNVVYVGSFSGTLYALQASTGAILWTLTTGGFIDSTPAVVNGILYIGSADSKVYAVNAATGAVVWSYTTGSTVESSPAVVNGVVYVGSDDNKIYALRAAGPSGGHFIWSYTTGAPVFGAPAVAYGLVYAASGDGKLYALNARSGSLQWSAVVGTTTVSTPAVANGVVYATSRDGNVNAYAASYGGLLFSAFSGWEYFGSPVVSDGILYVAGENENISAYSLLAGSEAARAPLSAPAISTLHPDFSLAVTRDPQVARKQQTVTDSY